MNGHDVTDNVRVGPTTYNVVLQGKYVTLRPLGRGDAALTQRWRTSGRAFLLNRGAQTVQQQAEWITSRPFDPTQEMNWVQTLTATGQPVGMLSLCDIDLVHKRAEPGHFLIGEPDAVKGMPVAFEAVSLLYKLAFDTLGLQRLWGPMASGNRQMLQFHKYMGWQEEGRLRRHYCLNGKWHDAILIGLLEEDYRAVTLPKLNKLIGDKS